MSIESAKAFIERMKTDEEFRNRVTKAETAEARKAIVEAEGFDFTKDEIEKVRIELSDDELDLVTGGGASCTSAWDQGCSMDACRISADVS